MTKPKVKGKVPGRQKGETNEAMAARRAHERNDAVRKSQKDGT